jgi:hypothetical protein
MTDALNIDLTDPGVQRMLGGHDGLATGKRRVVQLAGDDPAGLRGMSSTTYLEHGKHEVIVVYKDTFLTVDVYLVPGQAPEIHLICPRCHKASRISGAHKAIDFDPGAPCPVRAQVVGAGARELFEGAARGRLSVEPFECTWETGNAVHVAGGVHTGVSLCRQKIVIDDNRARDA